MVLNENRRKRDAPAVMKERGRATDELVLSYIKENPNSTIKEISAHYNLSNGRVDHSINRLKEQGLVDVTFFRRKRGLVKKVRVVDTEIMPFNEISFPLIGLDNDIWKDEIFICALSRSAIGISPIIKDKWKERGILIQKSDLIRDENIVNFRLPDKFVDFYEIPNSELDVSGFGDEILVTIDSTVIPVELPYNYEPQAELNYLRGNLRFTFDAAYEFIQCKVRPGHSPPTSEPTVLLSLEDLLKGATIHQTNEEVG
ncbi:MAG: winged helix-turn-helix domain-containing protein [Candidatus Bathyarchaeota archaeon]|nr:winged helix-turn-helix domain-containing protein [Candidatus Bathyarchaeota archaeon]